jgi:hypothetical protein
MSETAATTERSDLETAALVEWLVCWRETMARRYGDPVPAETDLYNLLGARPLTEAPASAEAAA